MAVKTYKPTSPARRAMTGYSFDEITRTTPEKSLLAPLISRGGRNNHGHLTVRHQGGGVKRMYRLIDFKRIKDDIPAKVFSIEYDPNRTARIALICYADGEKSYILAPVGLKVGDTVISGENVDIKPGNALPLRKIPVGTLIHNIELKIGKGGQLVRSAGVSAQLMAKESEYVHVRLPSNEMRLIHGNCKASIGEVGNLEHENVKIGKAGRSRHMGIRPTVRGVAMNPVDHPHGGGEGRSPVGHKSPLSPWGQKTNGFKTRKKKASDKYIVTRRSK